MLGEACDVSADRIRDHGFGLRKRFAVGDASRQRGDNRGKPALRFRLKNHGVASFVCHTSDSVHCDTALVNHPYALHPPLAHRREARDPHELKPRRRQLAEFVYGEFEISKTIPRYCII